MERLFNYINDYFGNFFYEPNRSFFLISNLIIFFVIIIVYRVYRKKILESELIDKVDLEKIKKIIWVFSCLNILLSLTNIPGIVELVFYSPLLIFLSALPTVIGLYIYFSFFSKGKPIDLPNYSDKSKLQEAVSQIVGSSDFISAFKLSLPNCDEDTKSGLSHIRFILGIIEDKRKRYKKEADRYLKYLFIVGILSIIIVSTLGYIILEENAFGFPRKINDLQNQAEEIGNELKIQNPNLLNNSVFQSSCGKSIEKLKELKPPDPLSKSTIIDINNIVTEFYLNNNLEYLITSMDSLKMNLDFNDNKKDIFEAISNTYRSAIEFKNSKEYYQLGILNSNREFFQLIKELRLTYSKPENRIPEILKRFILSAVIVTFLIFIIKFLMNLYKNQYYQMILAEKQDLIARKFYITFKGTELNTETRKEVISKFLLNEDIAMIFEQKKNELIDANILQQIINLFSKK